jgi:hypothetical protein
VSAGRLARIDARVMPALARAVRAAGRGVAAAARLAGPPGRWAARWSRRNPTIAFAIVAVLAAAGLIVTTGGDTHHAVAPAPPAPSVVLPGNTLGPAQGQLVSAYLAEAAQRRSDLDTSRAAEVTAVVDLNSYLNASAAQQLLDNLPDVTVVLVYARAAPPAAGRIHALSIPAGSDMGAVLDALATQARQFLALYHRYERQNQVAPSQRIATQIAANADRAAQAQVDSVGVGSSVACVFAMEVSGPPSELRSLSQRPDVRVLDPAPSNVPVSRLMIVPLEPQVQVQDQAPVPDFAQSYSG